MISFATQPGNVAADGTGADGPYATALAASMHQPGLDIFHVFNQVGLTVKRSTGRRAAALGVQFADRRRVLFHPDRRGLRHHRSRRRSMQRRPCRPTTGDARRCRARCIRRRRHPQWPAGSASNAAPAGKAAVGGPPTSWVGQYRRAGGQCRSGGSPRHDAGRVAGVWRRRARPTRSSTSDLPMPRGKACRGTMRSRGIGSNSPPRRAWQRRNIGWAPCWSVGAAARAATPMRCNGTGAPRTRGFRLPRSPWVGSTGAVWACARDLQQRNDWYRRAAEHGNPVGQWALGNFYQFGDGMDKDMRAGAAMVRRAADQGFVPAEVRLGLMSEHGNGVPQDYAEALRWFRQAAEREMPMRSTTLAFSIAAAGRCRKTMRRPCGCFARPPTRAPRWRSSISDCCTHNGHGVKADRR